MKKFEMNFDMQNIPEVFMGTKKALELWDKNISRIASIYSGLTKKYEALGYDFEEILRQNNKMYATNFNAMISYREELNNNIQNFFDFVDGFSEVHDNPKVTFNFEVKPKIENYILNCNSNDIKNVIDQGLDFVTRDNNAIVDVVAHNLLDNWNDKNFSMFAEFLDETMNQMTTDLKEVSEFVSEDLKLKTQTNTKDESEEFVF